MFSVESLVAATVAPPTRRRDEPCGHVLADHLDVDAGQFRQPGNRDGGKCWHGPRRCLDDTNGLPHREVDAQ